MDHNEQDDQLNDSFDGEFPPQGSSDVSGLDSSSDAETLQKKRRTVSPFVVAASPPKFVTFDNIMQAASGVSNMALAHEIAVDSEFKLEKLEAPQNSIEKQVKEVMHKVFWDVLQEKLAQDPPDNSHALLLLAEVKEILLTILLPQHQRLKVHIEEVLDLDLIKQKAENEAMDIMYYADFIISIMARLCAPVRDDQIAKLREVKEVVPLFKEVFAVLDLMKMDMANFTIQQIRPYLQQQSADYERKKFQDFIAAQEEIGLDGLEMTKKWLERNFTKLQSESSSQSQGASASSTQNLLTPASILNTAYIELLNWDENLQLYPETLVMDYTRFSDLRDKKKNLSLISSLLLLTYTTAGQAIAGINGFKEKLKKEIAILLDGVPESEIKSKIAHVADHVIRQVDECLVKHAFPALDQNQQSSIRGQFVEVVNSQHPVHTIITARVHKFIKELMVTGCKSPMKLPPGLSAVETELSQVTGQFLRLVSHNRSVFGLYYADIISTMLRRERDEEVEGGQASAMD
ncbi:T-complex protein 11-like protein 1 [Lineus longissimus]|uniref:T-complex protein 11-like protein 1 n=1 Tax=Lineus longissimus TaxID=88925 RepID=UPI002B4E9EF2